MNKGLTYILLFLLIISSTDLMSQTSITKSKRFGDNWYLNANVGFNQFYGDMSDESPFYKFKTDTRFGFGLRLGKMIEPWIGFRFQFWYGQLKSTRRDILPLGEYYISQNIFEGNLSLCINFTNMFFGFKPGRFMDVYGLAGLGITSWQSRRYQRYTDNLIAENGYKGSGPFNMTSAFVFPLGAGANFNINKHFAINLESTWHIVNSDIVDVKEGGSEFDIYTYTSLGLTYKFNWGKGSKAAEVDDGKKEKGKKGKKKKNEKVEDTSGDDVPKLDDRFYKEDKKIADDIPDVILPDKKTDNQQKVEEDKIIVDEKIVEKTDYTVEYRVQIRASFAKPVSDELLASYNIPAAINEERSDGFYRYTIGSFNNIADAEELKRICQQTYGIPDAFVVAYADGKRLKSLTYVDPAYSDDGKSIIEKEIPTIKYGVQIAASHNPISIDKLSRQYNLNEPIRVDRIDGWYKYSVGAFDEHWKANEYRNILLTRNNIKGCFVIAYQGVERKTIPELFDNTNSTNDNIQISEDIIVKENQTQNVNQDGKLDKAVTDPSGKINYRIQILSTDPGTNISVSELKDKYGIVQNIDVVREDGVVKYLVGYYDKYDDASMFKEMMIEMGLKQSFVVGFSNGKRVRIK